MAPAIIFFILFSLSVDTFISPNNKLFYVFRIGYKDHNGVWINQKLSLLESDIVKAMVLLRKSVLNPVKSYDKIKLETI